MRLPTFILFCILAAALFATSPLKASITWTYDFPGTPGSGLGNGQTNPQVANVTFSDFTRTNLTQVGTGSVFDTTGWSNGSGIDLTQYDSFTITANAGWHLDLTQLTFDQMRTAGGPTKGHINMYVNGSITPWDTFDWNPTPSVLNQTFDFTDTVDADNVTTVEFRFYGWNGGTAPANMMLDNVTITVGIVPEPNPWYFATVPVLLALGSLGQQCWRFARRANVSV